MFKIFGPIFEQNANVYFEQIANFGPTKHESVNSARIFSLNRVYMGCTGGMRSIMRSRPSEANQLLGNLSEALIRSSAVSGKVLTGLPKVWPPTISYLIELLSSKDSTYVLVIWRGKC